MKRYFQYFFTFLFVFCGVVCFNRFHVFASTTFDFSSQGKEFSLTDISTLYDYVYVYHNESGTLTLVTVPEFNFKVDELSDGSFRITYMGKTPGICYRYSYPDCNKESNFTGSRGNGSGNIFKSSTILFSNFDIVSDKGTLVFPASNEEIVEYSPAYDVLGCLRHVTYNKLYTRSGVFTDKLFYRFSWSGRTSTGVDLSKDEYDIIYYWECYSIEKTFSGKIKQSDSLFSDKRLVKNTQENYFTILQNAYEGQFYDIYKSVYDTQPFLTKDFQVITKLHIAPVFRSGDVNQIGLWTHVTFDNAGTTETVQDTVGDLADGDGLEAPFDVETDFPDGTSDILHNKNTVGVGSDINEALHNSASGNSTIIDTDLLDSFNEFDIRSLDDIFIQLSQGVKGFANLFNIVFSWVPQWLQYSIIAAISIWVFMLIKKAIFG